MKKPLLNHECKLYLTLLCVAFFVTASYTTGTVTAAPPAKDAGSAVVEKRRIVLVRSGKLASDFPGRRRAVINYPVIKGLQNPVALKKVRSMLRIEKIFDTSIAEYKEDAWLTSFDYKVNYNKNYILDLTFTQDGVGAYPDTHTKHFALNLKSGEVIKARDVFKTSALETLRKMIDAKLQAEIKSIIADGQNNSSVSIEDKAHLVDTFKDVRFELANLNEFSIGERGITFLYDAGFPHVIQALEPEGQYFLDYKTIASYIKSNSVLAVFSK